MYTQVRVAVYSVYSVQGYPGDSRDRHHPEAASALHQLRPRHRQQPPAPRRPGQPLPPPRPRAGRLARPRWPPAPPPAPPRARPGRRHLRAQDVRGDVVQPRGVRPAQAAALLRVAVPLQPLLGGLHGKPHYCRALCWTHCSPLSRSPRRCQTTRSSDPSTSSSWRQSWRGGSRRPAPGEYWSLIG